MTNSDRFQDNSPKIAGLKAASGRERFGLSRRNVLKVGMLMLAATAGLGLRRAQAALAWVLPDVPGIKPNQRRAAAYRLRCDAARLHLLEAVHKQINNGDEDRYADLRASFFKGLPQNSLGEVEPDAYALLLAALYSGDPDDIAVIPLSPSAKRKLVNPQAAHAYEMVGADSHATNLEPPPAFASAQAAAEIGEVYWMSLCRDIPFRDFQWDQDIAAAVADLNKFSQTVGPKEAGQVTAGTLFRGESPGDLIGPYLSQFLWQDIPYGAGRIVQRYDAAVAGVDFVTNFDEWLAIQQGTLPVSSPTTEGHPRYINNLRTLSHYVHYDVVFQAFFNAALIILGYGPAALDGANPYLASTNQDGFITFGPAHVLDLVTKAARVGLEGAWFHKWLVHRRLRPELMGGRIEIQRAGFKHYGINDEVFASEAITRVVTATSNALLPQAYPEGSPLHPSYPAGHAAIAGACVTVLKAFFNEDFVIPDPVEASTEGEVLEPWTGADLTLGNELNKLASNISVGRCAAGIHYRSDNRGLVLGEAQAIGLLRDYSITYTEDFAGFTLTKFNGQKVHIADGKVLPV